MHDVATATPRFLRARAGVFRHALLVALKYGGFVMENFQNVVGFYGMTFDAAKPDIFLRRSQPSNSPLDFALYVTFFPQLVAGPIVRATQFLPQCAEAKRATRVEGD